MSPKNIFTASRMLPIGALCLFGLVAFALHGVLVALAIALVAAYLLNPPVLLLQALRVPRMFGAFIVLMTVIGAAVFVVFVGVPDVAQEILEATARIPAQFEALRQSGTTWISQRFHVQVPVGVGDIAAKFGNELRSLAPNPADIAGAFSKAMGAVVAAVGSLVIPIFTYYFLVDFPAIVRSLREFIPRPYSASIEGLAGEIDSVISRYVRGQATKSLLLAILYAVGLRIVGVRLAIPIGILTGMLTFIPYVGVAIGMLLAVFMTLLDWHSINHLWAVLTVMSVIVIIDGQIITPRVVGASAPLKTIEVLLAMVGSVSLFGAVGLLFAVPLGAIIKILFRRIAAAYMKSNFYLGVSNPPPTPVMASESEREQPSPGPSAATVESSSLRTIFKRFSLRSGGDKTSP